MDCSLSGSSVHGDSPDKNTGVGCHALLYLYLIYISSLVRKTKIDLLTLIKVNRGKESACNAGNPSSILESGGSSGEGIGYPLQYSWSSLVAQMVKNLPATWETWVWSLGWEDSLEEGIATHSSILVWRIPMDRGTWRATVHGVAKSRTQLNN